MMEPGGGLGPVLPPTGSAHAWGIRLAQRDALPLPHLRAPPAVLGRSRGRCQRQSRAEMLVCDHNRCVDALNSMYGEAVDEELMRCSPALSAGQLAAQSHVWTSCRDAGRPSADLDSAEALRALRIAGPYGDDAPLGPVTFDAGKVSLPLEGAVPVALDVLWGPGGSVFLERLHSCLAPADLAAKRLAEAPAVAYCDPSFGHPAVWEDFVWTLARAGLVDFAEEATEVTGVFFVPKKGGKQRMVLDARRSNAHFMPAEGVTLCTGSSLASIELEGSDVLYIGHADLQNAFYHLQLPEPLRRFFGLREVRASRVPSDLRHLLGGLVSPRVRPRLAVVPMGFSWIVDMPADPSASRRALRPWCLL